MSKTQRLDNINQNKFNNYLKTILEIVNYNI